MQDGTGTEASVADAQADASTLVNEGVNATAVVENTADVDAEQTSQEAADAQADAGQPDEMKIVVSIRGGQATVGVQRTAADPHIESFDGSDVAGLAQQAVGVVERARARWDTAPRNPAYERPTPQPNGRPRRGRRTAQASAAESGAEQEQPATLRLF